MSECAGRFFVLNGQIENSEKFDKSLVYEGDSVYEVFRVLKGIPVFFDDHIARLMNSVISSGKQSLADKSLIRESIIKLIQAEGRLNSNMKIVFNYNNASSDFLIYYIETNYPTRDQYDYGVKGILYYAERNDPTTKVIDQGLRSAISEKLIKEDAYEAILVNESNEITEGSRSNIFFLKNNMLVTAPEGMVLNGITRRNILKICKENDIGIEFRCVTANELNNFDAVIMTGTSPVAIPFSSVDNIIFKTDFTIIQKIRQLYFEKADESIRDFRQMML